MKPIAVFYHCRLKGSPRPETYWEKRIAVIDPEHGREVFRSQLKGMADSNLYYHCDEFHIGNNGEPLHVYGMMWEPPVFEEAQIHEHGYNSESLRPTMSLMQDWLLSHQDYNVLFFHSKGVTHPCDPLTSAWRKCMEKHCIWNWRRCVDDLNSGFDTAGAHWVTVPVHQSDADDLPVLQSRVGKTTSYWGGTFWWATASYLLTLPRFSPEIRKPRDWHLPELWIGLGDNPKVKDYAPHFPGLQTCSQT